MALAIRTETGQDHDAIRRVHADAFGSNVEPDLLGALRAEGDLLANACLVGIVDDEVVGHVAFSRATVASGEPALALGPAGVLPAYQRQGIGGALIREGLRRVAASPAVLVVLLGDPRFYRRVGFEPARPAGLECPWDVPDEVFMFQRLPGYKPEVAGLVSWAPAFARFT
jgi:putative acetyltransferase